MMDSKPPPSWRMCYLNAQIVLRLEVCVPQLLLSSLFYLVRKTQW